MANILVINSATILDAAGVKAPYPEFWSLPDTMTLAQTVSWFQGVGEQLDHITDGQIIDYRIDIKPDISGWTLKSGPVAQSNVEKTGLFNYAQAGSKYKSPLDVPAISLACLTTGERIDFGNTDIINYVALHTSPGIGGEDPVSKYKNLLTAVVDAITTFRKHRRSMNRSTFEPGS